MPMTPPFAMVLESTFAMRLKAVEQVGFDRVLAFRFDTKDGERTLYVEVFQDGNIILVDSGVIIQPLTHASLPVVPQKGVEPAPSPAVAPMHCHKRNSRHSQASDRDLVSTLGGKINLGATHANAVCSLAI